MGRREFDVAILGGGAAGLSAAIQLKTARPQTSVVVVEKRQHPVPPTAHKVGEALAEISSHYYAHVLGLERHLDDAHLRKMGLRWFMRHNGNQDISRRIEFGLHRLSPLKTFMIDRGTLENHMARVATGHGVEFIDSTEVSNVELSSDVHTVALGRGAAARALRARWVVDATGRQAMLRHKLGLGVDLPIEVNAAWFRIPYRLMIDEWCDSPEWKRLVPSGGRWRSTCSFVGRGYWTWVINLASGSCSVGVVADPDLVSWEEIRRYEVLLDFLRREEPQLASHLPRHESELLDFMKRRNFSHITRRAFSRNRWALAGEAALFVDPLYSTGHDTLAMGNQLLTDLIRRDLDGESGREFTRRVQSHNRALLSAVRMILDVFPGALHMYGAAQATAAKLTWDNVLYFSVMLNMFRHEGLSDPDLITSLEPTLRTLADMNTFMQSQFRHWATLGDALHPAGIPNQSDPLMSQMIASAMTNMSSAELKEHINRCVRRLHTMSLELLDRMATAVGEEPPPLPYDPPGTIDEDLLLWSDWDNRTGPLSQRIAQPEDGWMVR